MKHPIRLAAVAAVGLPLQVGTDRAHLTHNVVLCPSPRTIDFTARGLLGRLDDARKEPARTPTTTANRIRLTWRSTLDWPEDTDPLWLAVGAVVLQGCAGLAQRGQTKPWGQRNIISADSHCSSLP